MRFSIIIPVYNAQKYLRKCITSVLAQTYPDYEIILVNDGSKDSSGDICDACCEEYPNRIRVIHSDNRGALIARATGVKNATGEIILFLDADDTMRSDALSVLHQAFQTSGCDLILFNGSVSERFDIPFRTYPFSDGSIFDSSNKEPVYRTLTASSTLNNVGLKAAKRHLFHFDLDYPGLPHIRHGEDLLMSAQLLTSSQRILVLDQNLYFYRQNTDSVVHSSQLKKADSVKAVHLFLEQLIAQWGFPQLIPVHHTRKVRGWIEILILLAGELSRKDFLKTAKQMSQDPYFRNAYEKMDAANLNWKYRLLSRLLYSHRCSLIYVITSLYIHI